VKLTKRRQRAAARIIPIAVGATLVLCASHALAQNDGGFFGRLVQGVQSAAARASWQSIEPDVQNCLQSQYNINPSDLADQGILPTDSRVAPDIDNCRQAIAQGQNPQAQQAAEDPAQRQKELTAKYGRKFAKEIISGNIDIGMNQDAVMDAWGNPDDRQQSAAGKEKWVYGKDAVTFSRGKVVAVGH
jgi:hypothetical protein